MTVVNLLDVKYKGLVLNAPFVRTGDDIILQLHDARTLDRGSHHIEIPAVIAKQGGLRGKKIALSAGSSLSSKGILLLNTGQIYTINDWTVPQHIFLSVPFKTTVESMGVLHIL